MPQKMPEGQHLPTGQSGKRAPILRDKILVRIGIHDEHTDEA
ncbi:hypothetical protein ACFLUC_02285 [Chloroflexota bacterium]